MSHCIAVVFSSHTRHSTLHWTLYTLLYNTLYCIASSRVATVLCAVQCSVVCHRCHCAVARAAFPALSLYTIPMYCTVLYSTVQHCHPGFLWWGTVLGHTPCCAVMRCTHCTARHTSLSYFNIMHCTTMHCNAKLPLHCPRLAPTASDCSSPPGTWGLVVHSAWIQTRN